MKKAAAILRVSLLYKWKAKNYAAKFLDDCFNAIYDVGKHFVIDPLFPKIIENLNLEKETPIRAQNEEVEVSK